MILDGPVSDSYNPKVARSTCTGEATSRSFPNPPPVTLTP
ncbi:hypothetical protein FHX81_6920 [Saccharothrix saharensis]|uniref:Uncharacterized protein n=1 Tax=Saccharothrix saharensis TaxID=571190 RepID=A0A543JNY4_9PSEU|nr:hypothetical protein FHX81_6920 [Saccharothrix saharensis]